MTRMLERARALAPAAAVALLAPTQAAAQPAVASVIAGATTPDQVEAMAFAWLAMAFVERRPGNLPAVTGAQAGLYSNAFIGGADPSVPIFTSATSRT